MTNPAVYVKKINGVRHVFDEDGNEVFDYYRPAELVPAKHVDPEPPQNFPPATEQAKGLMATMTTWAKEGFPLSKDKAARWALCEACPDIQDGRCLHCGCFMRGKIYLDTAHCALGKW